MHRGFILPPQSVIRPDSLYIPEHQPAHGAHRVLDGGEDRRPPPQQLPVLTAQHLTQELDVAIDRLDIGIAAAVELFQPAIGGAEVAVETVAARLLDEV